MNSSVKNGILLYCNNYLALKKPLFWKTSSLYIKLCALSYTFEGNQVNPEILLDAVKYIKKNTKPFSYLRYSRIYSAAFLTSGRKNIESEFQRLSYCYKVMKDVGFHSSTYLPIAAYALYSTTTPGLEQKRAETAKLIHQAMKMNHPLLTTSDDYASAIILASSHKTIDELMLEVEKTYQALKAAGFRSSNGLQFLSHILIFDGSSPEEKALRCKIIADKLKEHKYRVNSLYYGIIGFLALTTDNCRQAIEEILEAIALLKEKKCYSFGQREFNLMIASALVCKEFTSGTKNRNTLLYIGLGATIEALIAAQVAACAAASAATSSAISASN